MTDTEINLNELRARANRIRHRSTGEMFHPDDVLALVEAVEAARACWLQVVPHGADKPQIAAHNSLRDALARFEGWS